MKKLITIVFLFVISFSHAQEISRSTYSSAGASAKNDQGYSVNWTMGAQFSQIVKDKNHLTEGFQQGILSKKASPVELRRSETSSPDTSPLQTATLNFTAYPNPTSDRLYLDLGQEEFQGGSLKLFDQSGKMISAQVINAGTSESIEITNVQALLPGNYLLQIISPHASTSIKFIKIK